MNNKLKQGNLMDNKFIDVSASAKKEAVIDVVKAFKRLQMIDGSDAIHSLLDELCDVQELTTHTEIHDWLGK